MTNIRTAIVAAALAALLGGCDTYVNVGEAAFGVHASRDMHPFVSTREMPVTLTLVDTLTGQSVWTIDIPPEKRAIVQFKHKDSWTASQTGTSPADEIRWEISDVGDSVVILTNSQVLNGDPVLLKWSITKRDPNAPVPAPAPATPADPKAEQPAPVPTPEPAPAPAPTPAPEPAPAPTPAPAPAPAPAPEK